MEPEFAAARFEDARRAVDRSSLDGTDAEKAGVMLLKARSGMGLAAGEGLKLGQLERRIQSMYLEIRERLRAWEDLNAQAEAAESYDPSAELDALASEAEAIRAQIAEVEQQKQAIDAQIAQLQEEIAQLQAQAKEQRDQAAELELKAAKMSAVEAAKIAPDIQKFTRAAEARLFDVARLEARIEHQRTGATEAALTLDKLRQQLEINQQAAAEIAEIRSQGQQEARAARGKATEAATELRSLCEKALAARTSGQGDEGEGLNAVSDRQIELLSNAVRNAGQAASQLRVSAKATLGSANIALGDALTTRGRSLQDLAELMDRLANATPPLQDSAWFADQGRQARAEAEDALARAKQAYRSAADDFGGVGGRNETRELLDRLVDQLRALAGEEPTSEPASGQDDSDGDVSADGGVG
ncbi:MAG: hypothetical protein Kow0022_07810 [Phycisphaerales bacterium]